MIEIITSSNQSVEISTQATGQEILIVNASEQEIAISVSYENQEVDILNPTSNQAIEIVTPWPTRAELEDLKIDISSKVPKALSILPQANDEQLATSEMRESSRIYIDIGGTPSFATLEQVKKLNTKAILVNELSDNRINTLSNEDFILLREE